MLAHQPVLLVEDNADDIILIQSAYEAAGIRQPLKVVNNGLEAIRYLVGEGKYGDRAVYPFPFLLLLDLKMPLKDGFQVLEWFREHPEIRGALIVIVLSGYEAGEMTSKVCRLGAQGFLAKPLAFADLQALMAGLKKDWIEGQARRPRQP